MSIRVVVADDHTLVRELSRTILERSGDIDVVGEATNGEEAIRLATELSPEVVLMDIAMPRIDGIEATRQIKVNCPATAILILTGSEDEQNILSMLEAGAAGYLLKTLHGDELVAAVRAVSAGESVLSPAVARQVLGRFATLTKGPSRVAASERLTERELEVLQLASRGLTNKAIGQKLMLSHRTVQRHLDHIFDKLGVASRTEAVIEGLKRGWLRLQDLP